MMILSWTHIKMMLEKEKQTLNYAQKSPENEEDYVASIYQKK